MCTAFGVVGFGLFLSVSLFLIEVITSKSGCCKNIMNAYNYKIAKPAHGMPTSAEAVEIIHQISDLLLQNHSKLQDVDMLSRLRTSLAMPNEAYDS